MTKPEKSEKMSNIEREVLEAGTRGKISCRKALMLAENMHVSPRAVGDAADRTGVKIVSCQLGCFGNSKKS